MNDVTLTPFDPREKEAQLRRESKTWDTRHVEAASPDDIPIIDVADYFLSNSDAALEDAASQLRDACLNVGFYSLIGHQFPERLITQTFEQTERFHSLAQDVKKTILMDRQDWPVKGIGYLPYSNRKLPSRDTGNLNEAFLIKRDHLIGFDDNQWLNDDIIPGFRECIEQYANEMETLAKRLLPIYARALQLDKHFFAPAFTHPMYRVRLTRYPSIANRKIDEFGIAPHVDTTFFTLLRQSAPGLVIYSEKRRCWISPPLIDNAFVVNTGELLKQWSNDLFISVKHFANNNADESPRYSIPFFINANADYKMTCLPTCCNENNPPKYPPISYLESQAVVQGE